MEENRFDPLQFIGFLLISGILMFWFYDNQSNYIENQQNTDIDNVVEIEDGIVDIDETLVEENTEIGQALFQLRHHVALALNVNGAKV